MQLMRIQSAGWIRRTALSLAVLLVLSVFAPTTPVSAAQTTLNLQILPIDCQFEIINDGQNTIRYITPEECGQIVEPEPEPEGPNSEPSQPTITPNSSADDVPFLFAVPEDEAPLSPVSEETNTTVLGEQEPFEPLARLQSVGQATLDTATSTTSAKVITTASIIAVTDVFLLNSTITTNIKRCGQWLRHWWRR